MSAIKKHICLVLFMDESQGFTSGTIEIFLLHAETLKENGYVVSMVFPENPNLHQAACSYTDQIHLILPTNGKRALGKNLFPALKVFHMLKPDAVLFHCPSYRWGLDIVLAARLTRIPIILRMEHNPIMATPEWYVQVLLRVLDAKMRIFLYVSEGNRKRFESLLPWRKGRGQVLYNCYNQNKLAVLPGDSTTLTSVRSEFNFPNDSKLALFGAGVWGTYDKDFRRPIFPILKAFYNLLNDPIKGTKATQWRLLVAGKGDEHAAKVVYEMGLTPYVRLLGTRNDLPRLMRHCDLLVTASHYEGAAISNLEAWAMGVPVLSTQVDGISDIIGDENMRKYMVPQHNIDAFAQAWYEFMIGDQERLNIHRTASSIVQLEHNTQKTKCRLVEFFHEVFLSN